MRSVVNGHMGLPKGPTPVVLLTLGLLGLHLRLQATPGARWSLRGLAVSWVGVSLTRPFYSADTFGLAVIGQAMHEHSDANLLAVGEAVRLGPGLVLLVVDLVLCLHQFLAPQPVHIGRGALIAIGCLPLVRPAPRASTHTLEARNH